MRTSRWPGLFFAALVLVAGCSGGPDELTGRAAPATGPSGSTAPPATTALPPTTPAPTTSAPTSSAPGATPAAIPVRTAVPARVMLRGPDWPGGTVRRETAALEQTEPAACEDRTAFPSDRYRLAGRTVSIASDEPESGGLHQAVVRYAPGRAAQAMTEMRRVLAACRGGYRPASLGPEWTRTYRLEGERFLGDDALLVRQVDVQVGESREYSTLISVVRLGDALVTTQHEAGEGTADPALARRLATVGADRAGCLRSTC